MITNKDTGGAFVGEGGWHVGVDGCRGGWCVAARRGALEWRFFCVSQWAELWKELDPIRLCYVDMPIGLPGGGITRRACDFAARRLLGRGRASSVFPPPARATLSTRDYVTACAVNFEAAGCKISRQAFNIMPKIRELDEWLLSSSGFMDIILEAHPELVFQRLAGNGWPLPLKREEAGRLARERVLRQAAPASWELLMQAIRDTRKAVASKEDWLDALALAVACTQNRDHAVLREPERDQLGLPMQIRY